MKNRKHAYLIIAHNNIKVLKVMIDMIDNEKNDIFLLIDKKAKNIDIEEIISGRKKSEIFILPRININWGGYSQIEGVLNLIEEAVKKNKYIYYHFMQGADLPIKSQEHIHKFFEDNYGKEFIEFNPYNYEFAKYKKHYHHFLTNNPYFRTNKLVKMLNHSLAYIQRALKIKRSNEKLYHGSALFSITNEFASYLISKKDFIRKEYRFTLACDEVFLQTIIMNSKFKNNLVNFEERNVSNCRYIDWENRKGNSPNTFKGDDYNKLINLPSNLCFARKFDENVDFEIVRKIKEHVVNN